MKRAPTFQLTLAIGVLQTLLSFSSEAQSPTNVYWIRYFNQFHFNKKWSWQSEFDERRSIQPDRQRQFIAHTYANYKLNSKNDLTSGITGSWVTNSKNLTVPELRFFQSITSKIATIGRIDVQTRFRLEERFFHNTDNDKTYLTDGFQFKFRTRYRLQFQRAFNNPNWTLRIIDEIMFHSDSSDPWKFDQNRAYVGIDRKLSKQLNLEIGYMLLHGLSNDTIVYGNILRTTLYHRINL